MARTEAPREIDQLAQAWEDRVQAVLTDLVGARRGASLAKQWAGRLPTSYRAGVAPDSAAHDVLALDGLGEDEDRLVVVTKHEAPPAALNGDGGQGMTRIVFARSGPRVELARAMPILSDLGLHVVEERSARLHGADEVWIQDFGVLGPDGLPLDLDAVGHRVEACIDAVWMGAAESDSLNRLVVTTSMGHARLEPLRAYRRYRQRLGSRFTESYQNDVIVQHSGITEKLVRLFELRFGSPDPGDGTTAAVPVEVPAASTRAEVATAELPTRGTADDDVAEGTAEKVAPAKRGAATKGKGKAAPKGKAAKASAAAKADAPPSDDAAPTGRRGKAKVPTSGPHAPRDLEGEAALRAEIVAAMDDVTSLDHDRILRNQLAAIEATYRTNAYRPGRGALALKLKSSEVPAIPQPTPLWETYVHGLTVEGIHLRGGMIARGGLRWSDRMDYRTEVLGLMRAQMVKNAVIVPTGAKGGFLLRGAEELEGEDLRNAVRGGYVEFVTALLDVADDLHDGEVVHPEGVRILDDDDTYLVVAADKGTATFSDTANEISLRRGYWLGDAFASGGSVGYDHKALGITARGAWESVKRHFSELNMDPENDPITVVGIGDMSGDVFGNGMLLSSSMRLIAAYDHRHVFVDPDPQNPAASWKERKRLFEGTRTSWDDYDRDLISKGGGVFPRTMKSVPLTDEIRTALGIDAQELAPAELIQAVLRAPVDLLWNGGIGTVVKASTERDEDAEDRASDAIRVNASDLRATVVGEGGNLGFTRAARVEYARGGGDINADFIDNSAGVDCSDHEVNLKILLNVAIRKGLLDPAERDQLLADVTEDVTSHVLQNSAAQARVLTQEERRAPWRTQAVEELMHDLEEEGRLQRADHGMPTDEELAERRSDGEGLTRPELAVLVALAKGSTARYMLDHGAETPDEPGAAIDDALARDVAAYFPPTIVERFGGLIDEHPLRRQIAATIAASEVVDTLGPTFVSRRAAEFGATPTAVVRAFRIAVGACDARELWDRIDALQGIEPLIGWMLRSEVDEMVRVTSRWFLTHAADAPIGPTAELHRAGVHAVRERLAAREHDGDRIRRVTEYVEAGVPPDLAELVAGDAAMVLAPHVVAAAERTGRSVVDVGAATLHLGERLSLGMLHRAIQSLAIPDRMTRWSVQALRDDLLDARVRAVVGALEASPGEPPVASVDAYLERQEVEVFRLRRFLRELSTDGEGRSASSAACLLAVRQLQEMGRA
ncbi:NAD-glutamate dehydrogenase domain-containing protein [Patulibacter minatonensis]|uniref:NAD-glutamate dehydrogenase domain-containing protein n=1 Tax=Patulibacter minatonensis TaxID=298163 RepID=UPI0006888B04|nr:NAD-glutamate dehydrogenase domain-containing protein [Patulibacter minatonensis]